MTLYAVAHVIARILFGRRGSSVETGSRCTRRWARGPRLWAAGPRGQLVLRNPLDGLGPDHPDTLITRNHLAYWTDVARPSG